jgi:hypothetical protein
MIGTKKSRLVPAVLLFLVAAGCVPNDVAGPRGVSQTKEKGAVLSLRQMLPPRSIRDEFRDLSRQFPGFTGVSLDENQQLVITHAGTGLSEATQREITSWASEASGRFISATARARLVRVNYSYLTLDSAQHIALVALRKLGRWNSTWIDEVKGSVWITYPDAADVERAKELLELTGLASDLVRVRQEANAQPEIGLRDKYRPVIGGLQINYSNDPAGNCSAGFNVYLKNESGYPDPSLGRFLITASHCTPHRSAIDSVTFGQPYLSNPIGIEVDEGPLYTSGYMCSDSITSIFDRCQVDVAVIQYHDTVSSSFMVAAKASTPPYPYSSNPTITGTQGLVNNQLNLFSGMPVRKVGHKTGQTDGTVTSTCITVRLDPPEQYIILPCLVKANYVSDYGDSGGVVYVPATDSTLARPAGVHMGNCASGKCFTYMTWVESGLAWKYYFY